jgi:hypothetical protein
MAYFDDKQGIVLEDGDLDWETPWFVSHFWEWILGAPRIEQSHGKKVNLLK